MKESGETMIEHNGYMISQMSDGDIMVYKDGRFYLHGNASGYMEEEELLKTVDELLAIAENLNKEKKKIG